MKSRHPPSPSQAGCPVKSEFSKSPDNILIHKGLLLVMLTNQPKIAIDADFAYDDAMRCCGEYR